MKTGYGQQAALLAPRLRDLGHDVAIGAYYGLSGTAIEWNGIPVFPGGNKPNTYGMDMIGHFAEKWKADMVIILADAWVGWEYAEELAELPIANWLPLDAYPLSKRDFAYLVASGAYPIAMSRFGAGLLADAGLAHSYVPHGIDTALHAPYVDPADRDALRAEMDIAPDMFVVGGNWANRDLVRKGFFEQFTAFSRFHAKHPNSRLYLSTMIQHPHGLDVISLAEACGIKDALIVPDQGALVAGEIDAAALVRNFYHLIDVYSGCALGEGFGIPLIEAQACGVPVVATDASAMTELVAPGGWLVRGDPQWVEGHQARWTKPFIGDIAAAYEDAYLSWQDPAAATDRAERAREHALHYDANRVLIEHWVPTLAAWEAR